MSNEALRLADELAEEAERRVCHVAMAPASLLKEAAALLRQQAERIAELEARVHTCGPTCSKAGCINRRLTAECDQLRAEVERLRAAIAIFCAAHKWAVAAWKAQPAIAPLFEIDADRSQGEAA